MSTTSQAYGLIPAYHPSGQARANKYTIASGYATAIYKGDLVNMDTANSGTLTIGDGTSACLGVFAGCEYIDANGKPVESPYWPASTTATNIVAYVYDDPANVYKCGVTANASSFNQTSVGDQVDIAVVAGNTNTGVSGWSVTTAPVGNGATAQLRIIGLPDGIYNATTNPYPQLLVQINQLQMVPNGAVV